jgi:hypothetical protein
MIYRFLSVSFITLFLFSCEKEKLETDTTLDFEFLTDTAFVQAVTPGTVRLLLSAAGYGQFKDYFKYKMEVYKIEYRTTYKDSSLTATGIICIPANKPPPWHIINIYHGLIFADNEAASSFSLPLNFIGYEFISSIGFAVFIPDLIGFGVTKDITFAIYNKEIIAKASVDMIYAGKEFLDSKNRAYADIYFGGYSLGAYDAIATLEYIANNSIDFGVPVSGAAIGAGGYNLYQVMKENVMKEKYPSPAQLLMLISSYNNINDWNRPLTHYFLDTIAVQIPHLLGGNYTADEINEQIPSAFDSLLTPEYLEILRTDQDSLMVNALRTNSVHTWLPEFPTQLYHSQDDEKIPYSDSEDLYYYILENGDYETDLVDISGENHFNTAPVYIEAAVKWIQANIDKE